MNLEVGNYYLNASGEIVKIESYENEINLFYDSSDNFYIETGICCGDTRGYDLIAEIPKELHWNLMYNIINYHTNKNVREKLKRKYNNYINRCVSKNKEIK